jgi:hypothetical protein
LLNSIRDWRRWRFSLIHQPTDIDSIPLSKILKTSVVRMILTGKLNGPSTKKR